MSLINFRIYGEASDLRPLYILHGIFGMSDNWHYHAQLFSKYFQVVTLDARNHGKSFHDDNMSFEVMAQDIVNVAQHLGHPSINLMGHSMGGKVVMKFSELFPQYLEKLVVVDIAPKAYPPGHEMYFRAFMELPLATFKTRSEADQAFEPYAPELSIRQFLLKNLEPVAGGGYKTKFYLKGLYDNYHTIIGNLELKEPCFTGPVMFVRGEKSGYVREDDILKIRRIYPDVSIETIDNAGHWVHADNPDLFYKKILGFIYPAGLYSH